MSGLTIEPGQDPSTLRERLREREIGLANAHEEIAQLRQELHEQALLASSRLADVNQYRLLLRAALDQLREYGLARDRARTENLRLRQAGRRSR